jgi:glycerol kinase
VYALEGSIFVAGAAIQWLRDQLGIIRSAAETEALATQVMDNAGVYFVPAFVGLGAPYWDPAARGAIIGLTRGVGRAHVARAALESIAYQTRDVVDAMAADREGPILELRIDGGAAANNFLAQFQSDILGAPVIRPTNLETTAMGAAYLAGLATGFWSSSQEIAALWSVDRRFEPQLSAVTRDHLYAGWSRAVARVRSDV